MTTRDVGIVLHEELDRREKLITQLTQECDGLRVAIGILERPTAEAHNRVTKVVSRRNRQSEPNTTTMFVCDKCGSDYFKGAQGIAVHLRTCDGIKRTRVEQNRFNQQRHLQKTGGNPPEVHTRQAKTQDEPNVLPARVPCLRCGEKFPDARALGIHVTRVHFGEASLTRAQSGGM